MAKFEIGHVFKTGNSVVNQLPEGTILAVSGQGELEILEQAEDEVVEVVPGVQFTSKRGALATVVDLTSTGGLRANAKQGEVFYVEDGQFRVRRTSEAFVQEHAV